MGIGTKLATELITTIVPLFWLSIVGKKGIIVFVTPRIFVDNTLLIISLDPVRSLSLLPTPEFAITISIPPLMLINSLAALEQFSSSLTSTLNTYVLALFFLHEAATFSKRSTLLAASPSIVSWFAYLFASAFPIQVLAPIIKIFLDIIRRRISYLLWLY